MHRVLGIGSALVDQIASVPDAFLEGVPGRKGGMELIDSRQMHDLLASLPSAPSRAAGGSAANTVVGVARLGLASRFLSKVGNDEPGGFYRDALEAAGVETASLTVHATEPTGTCISLVTPDSQRTMRTCMGAAAGFSVADGSAAAFEGCTHVHIEGYMLYDTDLMLHLLRAAKDCGCSVSLDLAAPEIVEVARPLLPAILREYTDMVFANEDEAAVFASASDARAGLDRLAAFCDLAAVKLGARGSLVRRGSETVAVPAERVEAVDTTGAGDLWAAGFLYGIFTGNDLETAGRIGSLAGAAVVQQIGAALPDSTWRDIGERVRTMCG